MMMRKIRNSLALLLGAVLIVTVFSILYTNYQPLLLHSSSLYPSIKLISNRQIWDPDLPSPSDQSCKIPQPDPWDKSVLPFIAPPNPIQCRKFQEKFFYIGSDSTLRINETALELNGYDKNSLRCFYSLFTRLGGKEDLITYSEEKKFNVSDRILIMKSDFVAVRCKNWFGWPIYSDILANPRPLPHRTSNSDISVFAFGVDSMSRLNFMRQLPETYIFLVRDMESIVIRGLTKVGGNTYPNMMAMLSGTAAQRPPIGSYFDSFPLVWKNFSQVGFTTVLAEDFPQFTIFNYAASGFYDQPTDHYLRPFFVAMDDHSAHKLSSHLCFGETPKHILHLEYLKKILKNKAPYFIFSFLTEISHNVLNQVGAADQDFAEFFRELFNEGYLNSTVVLVFGDHGHRFDPIRMTPIGRIESSMPFLSIYLPPIVKNRYPMLISRLKLNSRRLTSMMDIYPTFIDILKMGERKWRYESNESFSDCGLSLFGEIPAGRTCSEAGIPEQFCMCSAEEETDKADEMVLKAAQTLVESVNSITEKFRDKCSKLKLNNVYSAHRVKNKNGEMVRLRLLIETRPNKGAFEGLVDVNEKGKILVMPHISRVNKYEGQADCVTSDMVRNVDIRKYCYCQI